MKSNLRRKITALMLCGAMIFSGSSSALADSPAGEIDENAIVQEEVIETVIEEADTEVTEEVTEPVTEEIPAEETQTEIPEVSETKEEVTEETSEVEEIEEYSEENEEADLSADEELQTEVPVEEATEETSQTEEVIVEATPTIVEKVATAVTTVTEAVEEVVEEVIRYIIGMHDDLTYIDENVTIKVYAEADEIIPEGTKIKVVPILADGEETKEKYEEVAAQLEEKAAEDLQEIQGFLAYDITLVDPDGNEFEPYGEVKVTMEYKNAALPEEVEVAEDTEVTVLHFEEDENGEVAQIVDMIKEEAIEAAVELTEALEVQKAEFVTASFSTYTITWTSTYSWADDYTLDAIVVDSQGNAIDGITYSDTEISYDTEYIFANECDNLTASGKTYVFEKAVVGSSYAQGTDAYSVNYTNSTMNWSYRLRYRTSSSSGWTDVGSNNVYLVYAEQTSSDDSEDTAQPLELAHQKYIKDNQDGTYDLTLNVIGAAGSQTNPVNIDVLFILDTSGSMDWEMSDNTSPEYGEDSRLEVAEDAISDAITAIEAKSDVNAKYALVTFAKHAETACNWTESGSSITGSIPSDGNGGTNYHAGVLQAQTLLSAVSSDGAKKIVVFLSDGNCTYYYSNVTNKTVAGNGQDYTSEGMKAAQNVVKEMNIDSFYTVGVGPSDSYSYLSNLNSSVATGVTTGSYNGTDADKLKEAFNAIVGDVTSITATDLTILDTLTSYVDPVTVDGNAVLTVKVTNASGEDVTTTEVAEGEIVATYDSTSKQVRLDFKDDYVVKKDYTYSVTIKIEPNAAAHQLLASSDFVYPNTGEENTDAPDNATSSGKKGIFSNVEDSAILTYTSKGEAKTADYNRPVVQIKMGNIQFQKVDEGGNALAGAVFKLYYDAACTESYSSYDNEKGTAESGADGVVLFEHIPFGTYYMKETSAPNGYKQSEEVWTIVISKDGCTISDSEGNPITDNKIVNKTDAKKNIKFTKLWDDYNNALNTRPASLTVNLVGTITVNGNEITPDGLADLLTDDQKTETISGSGNKWTYTFEEIPVYYYHEGVRYTINWKVTEGTISGYEKDYEGSSSSAADAEMDKIYLPSAYTSYLTLAGMPEHLEALRAKQPTQAAEAASVMALGLEDEGSTFALRSSSEDEISVAAYDSGTTYAGPSGSSGSSSSSTFNHLDIQADGSYDFKYNDEIYTVTFDFYTGTWTCKDSEGNVESSGMLSVNDMVITQTDADNDDDSFDSKNITSSGSWQTSNISGQSYEYRISGSFDRDDKFTFHFEIPVQVTDASGTVTINLVSEFTTYYADTVYNLCPDGGGKGIDIELDSAIDQAIQYNILALTKEFKGLGTAAVPATTFTLTKPDGTSVTLNYSDFADGYTGNTSLNNLPAGQYTITENVSGTVTGYNATGTTVVVNGAQDVSYDGNSATFTIVEGTTVSVKYVNAYSAEPQKHNLTVQKVWADANVDHTSDSVSVTITYSDGTNETSEKVTLNAANSWTYTKEVEADVYIESVVEDSVPTGYTASYSISSSGEKAVVTNKASSSTYDSLTVEKVWNDENNKYGKRPEKITVALLKSTNGAAATQVETRELSSANGWSYTFTNLQTQLKDGDVDETYTYSVKEVGTSEFYTATISNVGNTWTITNSINTAELDDEYYIVNEVQTQEIALIKYWNDNNDKYNSRPESLTLNLYEDGNFVRSFPMSSGDATNNQWVVVLTVPVGSSNYTLTETFPNTSYETMYTIENFAFGTDSYTHKEYDSDGNVVSQKTYQAVSIANTPKVMDITVTKEWKDSNNAYGLRPSTLKFYLEYRHADKDPEEDWVRYDEAAIEMIGTECVDKYNTNLWYYTITNLPISDDDGEFEYRIVEVVPDGYELTMDGASTMINTLKNRIIKRSTSVDPTTGSHPVLPGAAFHATNTNGKTYYGVTNSEGVLEWTGTVNVDGTIAALEATLTALPNGTYTLSEVIAPTGYAVSTETWEITYLNGVVTVKDIVATNLIKDVNGVTIYFDNTPLYELPSTGGLGIYVPMIGGVIMMMAAALILMSNKRREVLER